MKRTHLVALSTAILLATTTASAETIDAVVVIDSTFKNVTFTVNQPVVIAGATKPTTVTFQRDKEQLLTFEVCDYKPPAGRSHCRCYRSDAAPYYMFSERGFVLQPQPKPAAVSGPRTDVSI